MIQPAMPAAGPLVICHDHIPALRSHFLAPAMAKPLDELASEAWNVNAQNKYGMPAPPDYIMMRRDGYSVENVVMVAAENGRGEPFSAGLFSPRGHNTRLSTLLLHDDFRLAGEIVLRSGFDIWSYLFPDLSSNTEARRIWLIGHSVEYFLLLKRLIDRNTAAVLMPGREYLFSAQP